MTEETINEETVETPDELELLKERADIMGITYHPSIGIEKLKAKIEERTTKQEDPLNEYAKEQLATIEDAERSAKGAVVSAKAAPTPQQLKMERRNKALRLIRIRITSMNPLKNNMKGEIFSAGNSEIGMVKKYVPFNAEAGWHVPNIILNVIKNKKFMTHYEVKQGNKRIMRHKLVPEYAIEIMPPLTPKELQELKQRQLMAQGQ